MNRIYLTTACALCLAACATEPTSQPAGESTAPADVQTSPATAEAAGEGIAVVDTPDVPKVAVTDEELGKPDSDKRICRRERRTGTHRAQRVCYTRAEIERMATKSKQTLDDMNRTSRAPIDR